MKCERKNIGPISFSNMTGGIANAYPSHSIAENQVADAINVLFEKRGFTKHKGFVGLDAQLAAPIRGHFSFKKTDGTELNIDIADLKIYSTNLTDSTFDELGTITSDTECYALNILGKIWICNGVDFVKVEDTGDVYRVGIVAPTGFTATAGSGGSLAAGTYQVYASYSRVVGSATLHSSPQLVNAALSVGASGTVVVAVTASTDPQVNKITIWMTDAGGSTLYYYGNANNTTGNITISSNANKNNNLLMYEQAAGNQLPPAFSNIWLVDGRIMGCVLNSNVLYYSVKSQNVFDLERFPTEYNIKTIPYNVLSGYVLNGDLFINTVGGLFKFAGCDLNSKAVEVVRGGDGNTNTLYFPETNLRSVVEYNNALWGITNDGMRIFDGYKFSIDISKHIKPFIDMMKANASNFMPAAFVYRRSGKRTEYRVSYNDSAYSTSSSNRSLILNLDSVSITDNLNYVAPWELTDTGFHSGYVNSLNQIVIAQNNAESGIIAVNSLSDYDYLCLNQDGALITEQTKRQMKVRTRTTISQLFGINIWERCYMLKKSNAQVSCSLLVDDLALYNFAMAFEGVGGTVNEISGDNPLPLPFILSPESPSEKFYKAQADAKGNMMALEISQMDTDDVLVVYEIEMYGINERNLFV